MKMTVVKVFILVSILTALVAALPAQSSLSEKRGSSDFEDDPIGYFTEQASQLLDDILGEDNVQVGDDVEITRNNKDSDISQARSDLSFEDTVKNYLKTHDATFKLPFDGTLRMGARHLENNELDFSLKFSEKDTEGRKLKVKKILSPIIVFLLLKAITVVPFVIGVLLFKAWNALQLSFMSFVVAGGLAIFQLCKKIAENNAQAQISAHGPWEAPAHAHVAARSLNEIRDGQKMAYAAYLR